MCAVLLDLLVTCWIWCLFPINPRLSKLLLRLPALRLISAAVTEELFFAGLIGNVQIDSIIPYILKMESTDYNSQAVSAVWRTAIYYSDTGLKIQWPPIHITERS